MVEHPILNEEVLGLVSTRGTVLHPLARLINFPEYWLIPRKWSLSPNMTEKMLAWIQTNSYPVD